MHVITTLAKKIGTATHVKLQARACSRDHSPVPARAAAVSIFLARVVVQHVDIGTKQDSRKEQQHSFQENLHWQNEWRRRCANDCVYAKVLVRARMCACMRVRVCVYVSRSRCMHTPACVHLTEFKAISAPSRTGAT